MGIALLDYFIPEVWSELFNRTLQKQLVYARAINTSYHGAIHGRGDVVHIPAIGDVTISDYVEGTTELSYEDLSDDELQLAIDQVKSYAFRAPDISKELSPADFVSEAVQQATYAMNDVVDQFIADTLVAGAGITTDLGDDTTPLEINSANVLTTLLSIARKMDDENVPRDNRSVIVPPWFVEDLSLANVELSTNNAETLAEGFVGRYAGFDILMSNNVPNTDSAAYKVVATHPWGGTFAGALTVAEAIRLQHSFATGMRGLYAFGAKVLKDKCIALATCNEAAEA